MDKFDSEEIRMMRRITVLFMFMMFAAGVCFAQNDERESISFTTYFPAPHGVFTNLRIIPGDEVDFMAPQEHTGTLYFNKTEQEPYIFIHKDTEYKWEKIISGDEWSIVTPGLCGGVMSSGAIEGELCSVPWHQNIVFSPPFPPSTKKVHVMVFLQSVPDDGWSPCAKNATDQWVGYPDNISLTNFTIVAGGSIPNAVSDLCNADGQHNAVKDWYTHAKVKWFAIGEE